MEREGEEGEREMREREGGREEEGGKGGRGRREIYTHKGIM